MQQYVSSGPRFGPILVTGGEGLNWPGAGRRDLRQRPLVRDRQLGPLSEREAPVGKNL
jgi:hypothetical protein